MAPSRKVKTGGPVRELETVCEQSDHSQSTGGDDPVQTRARRMRMRKQLERVNRGLGPQYISKRAGPSGREVQYIEGGAAVHLANELFGNARWSSRCVFREVNVHQEMGNKWIAVAEYRSEVTVVWEDGRTNVHEGTGVGAGGPCRTQAEAREKAVKEAETDSIKRALKLFGEATGNCLYDPDFRRHVESIRRLQTPVSAAQRWPKSSLISKAPWVVEGEQPLSGDVSTLGSLPVKERDVEYDDEFGDDAIFEDGEGF